LIRSTLLTLVVFGTAIGPSSGSVRVHFVSGGSITGERAWTEDGNLWVESGKGVVGFPVDLVARVDSVDDPEREPLRATASRPVHDETQEERDLSEIQEASGALREGDVDRAALLFHRALQDAPERPDARLGYALAEMLRGRDPVALAVVLDGLVLTPDDPGLLEILGDLRDREERVEDALRSWRKAHLLAPNSRLEEKIARGERELLAGRDYSFSATSHFTVRHDGELDENFSGSIVDHLEDRWTDLTSVFRHAPSQPITVILYPDRDFRDVTGTSENVAGVYDGKIRIPLGGLGKMDPTLQRVLSHELTHAIVHSKTRGRAPRWLQEGLAQWSEPRPLLRRQILEIRGPLLAGDPATWHNRAFSYPAALSLILWMEEERGFAAIVSVLDRLGEGASLDAALSTVFGGGYAELCRRWIASLKAGDSR
jgi:hypothetical protein